MSARQLSKVLRTKCRFRRGSARRSRGHQCDGERITAQHHEGDQPADGALCVGVGADEFRDVADGRGLGLDPVALGGQGGAFRLGRAMSNRERGAAQVFGPLHLDEHTEALLFRIALFLRLDESLPDLLIYRAGLVDFRGPIEARNAAPRQ